MTIIDHAKEEAAMAGAADGAALGLIDSTISAAAAFGMLALALGAAVWRLVRRQWRNEQALVQLRGAHDTLAADHKTLATAHQALHARLYKMPTREEMFSRLDRIDSRLDAALASRPPP